MAGGSLSPRGLARSVARRLKYYVDVQRKEDHFDSSVVIQEEFDSSCLRTPPTCWTQKKDNKKLEHDFDQIKLEASLRAYMGSSEECKQKIQKSPERQKELEKLIKKMAQDYVSDRTHKDKGKSIQRRRKLQRSPVNLCETVTPPMSAEVRRLISSASKLIVAATFDSPPEELETIQEGVSSSNRRHVEHVQNLDDNREPFLSSTHSPSSVSRGLQGCHEESSTELDQRTLEDVVGRKSKKTKKEKNAGKFDGHSCKSFKIKKPKTFRKPAQLASTMRSSRSRKFLDQRLIQDSRNIQEAKGGNFNAKSRAGTTPIQHSTVREKTRKQYNSKVASGCTTLKKQGNKTHDQVNQKDKLAEHPQRNQPQKSEQEMFDSASKTNLKCLRVHFQKQQQDPSNTEWQHQSMDNFRDLKNAIHPTSSEDKVTEIVTCLQEDQCKELGGTSSFLYQVCQGTAPNSPPSLTVNESRHIDGNIANQSTGTLLNHQFFLTETGDSKTKEGPASSIQMYGEFENQPSEDEKSDDEFTISSTSRSLSAISLFSQQEQMSGNSTMDLNEKEKNPNCSTECFLQKVLDAIEDSSSTQQERACQHRQKRSSPDEDERKHLEHGMECISAKHIVYFSNFPVLHIPKPEAKVTCKH